MYGKQTRWWFWDSLSKWGIWCLATCGSFSAFLTLKPRVKEGDLRWSTSGCCWFYFTQQLLKGWGKRKVNSGSNFMYTCRGLRSRFPSLSAFTTKLQGGYTLHLNVSFLLAGAIPLEALIILPTGNGGRNVKLLLWLVLRDQRLYSLGEWVLDWSWIAGQISPQSGKCICCQVIHFLPPW